LIAHALVLAGYLGGIGVLKADTVFERGFQGATSAADAAVVVAWWAGVAAVVGMLLLAVSWRVGGWSRHPIVQRLAAYPHGWRDAARQIERDYARMDKVSVPLGNNEVVLTTSWLLQTRVSLTDSSSVGLAISGHFAPMHSCETTPFFFFFFNTCIGKEKYYFVCTLLSDFSI
jgi:hypothetical protein